MPITLPLIRNILAVVLIIVSLACLYPGLTQPILNITIGTTLPFLGKIEVFNQTQSITESIQSLYKSGDSLVAGLILFFSIVVPVIKAALLILILAFQSLKWRQGIYTFVGIISKWSMADVFAVAVFMAYLGAKAHPNVQATLHEGFFYFLAYCLISIASVQVMTLKT